MYATTKISDDRSAGASSHATSEERSRNAVVTSLALGEQAVEAAHSSAAATDCGSRISEIKERLTVAHHRRTLADVGIDDWNRSRAEVARCDQEIQALDIELAHLLNATAALGDEHAAAAGDRHAR